MNFLISFNHLLCIILSLLQWHHVSANSYKEELLNWKPPGDLQRQFPYYHSGYDDDGRPIWVVEIGKADIRTNLEKGKEWKLYMDKYVDQGLLRLNESIIEVNTDERPVHDFQYIIDLQGYNMRQFSHLPTVQFTLGIAAKFAVSCRATLHQAYLLNGNYVSEQMWNLAKPLLGAVLERMEFYGTNPARWRPLLLKKLPKSQLQEWYGGTAKPKDIIKVYG